MEGGPRHQITALAFGWRRGDTSSPNRLLPLVYHELRRRAHRYMLCERPGHSLQTTGLTSLISNDESEPKSQSERSKTLG